MPSQTFTSSGTWTAPSNLAAPPQVQAWGPGGAGGSGTISVGGGGGGGEFAAENTLGGVTPGSTTLTITIAAASSTTVTGGSVTVTGHAGGAGSTSAAGAGGTGSSNSVHHNGGAGSTSGGGGSSAGPSAAGNAATSITGATAPTGGGNGGTGNATGSGGAGSAPGGGGGAGGASFAGGAGAHGQVIITWSVASTTYSLPRPARGAPAAFQGRTRGLAGAPYVSFPARFTPPRKPAAGKASAVRGRGSGNLGHYTAPPPVVVSPFVQPGKPSKGAPGRKGSSHGIPGAPYVEFPAFFVRPVRPAHGQSSAVRGHSASSPGARYVLIRTSPFPQPGKPAAGRRASRLTGRGYGMPGARFVLIRTSPFYPLGHPARGAMALRRGRWSAGSATGQGAPQVPRPLIIAIASAGGKDDYGNQFVQGILVNDGIIQGEVIAAQSIVKGTLAPGAVDDFVLNAVQVNSGTVVASDIIISGTSGGEFAYSSGGTITNVYSSSGSFVCPAGVTSIMCQCWAGGGGGGGTNSADDPGGGGGGGEYAQESTLAVTPGHTYTYTVGAAGTGAGSSFGSGGAGGNTVFHGDSVTVTAHGGGGGGDAGFALGGGGGSGSTNSVHYSGGSGSTASTASGNLGGGGGSAGTNSRGNPGSPYGYTTPAVLGGGPGSAIDASPVAGPGGGGGGYGVYFGGDGWQGQIAITYTSTSPQLIASIAGAATTDPVAGSAVPEGIASDHVSVTSTGIAPATPSGRCVLYYDGGVLYALGPSGTPVAIATT